MPGSDPDLSGSTTGLIYGVKISTHLSLAAVLLVFATVGGLLILRSIDPSKANLYQFIALYVTIFAWVFGAAQLFGYGLRIVFLGRGVHYDFLRSSRRQAVLLGLLATAALILSSYSFLNLWTIIPLLFIFFTIELYSH